MGRRQHPYRRVSVRILVVTDRFPPAFHGGYEIECAGVVAHLRREHDVTVLTSSLGRRGTPVEPGVVRRLPFVAPGWLDSITAPADQLRAARVAREVIATAMPDLVFVWNGSGLPYVALQVLTRSGAPLAFRVCEQWFGGLWGQDRFIRHLEAGETGLRGLWARGMRLVDRLPQLRAGAPHPPVPAAISYNSAFLRDTVGVPAPIAPTLVEVIHPATPHSEAMADVARIPAPTPVVLFVGRLESQKGAQVAIAALARLSGTPDLGDTELVLVGNGTPARARELTALARSAGVGGRVRLTGPLIGAALHAEVARAWAWVVPSLWDEPAGLVCVEACLARVPLVAARVGGIPELVRDGIEASLFDRGDDEACAAALAAALRGGPEIVERVARATTRAHELGLGPYLEATDRFVQRAVAG